MIKRRKRTSIILVSCFAGIIILLGILIYLSVTYPNLIQIHWEKARYYHKKGDFEEPEFNKQVHHLG